MSAQPSGWILVAPTSAEGLVLRGPAPALRYVRASWLDRMRRRPCTANTLMEASATVSNFQRRLRAACSAYAELVPPRRPDEPADPWQALRDALAQWLAMADACDALERMTRGPSEYVTRIAPSTRAERPLHAAEVEDLEAWLGSLERAVCAAASALPPRRVRPATNEADDEWYTSAAGAAAQLDTMSRRRAAAADPEHGDADGHTGGEAKRQRIDAPAAGADGEEQVLRFAHYQCVDNGSGRAIQITRHEYPSLSDTDPQ